MQRQSTQQGQACRRGIAGAGAADHRQSVERSLALAIAAMMLSLSGYTLWRIYLRITPNCGPEVLSARLEPALTAAKIKGAGGRRRPLLSCG